MSDITDPDEWMGDDIRPFYHALGRLFHRFAGAEASLSLEVTNYVAATATPILAQHGADDAIRRLHAAVRVVAQGGRYADRKDAIKRLVRADRADPIILEALNYLFQQFGEIQRLRHELAHHPAINVAPDVWRISTFSSARDLDGVTNRFLSIEAMHNASDDLRRISTVIVQVLGAALARQTADGGLSEVRRSWISPWQYKPSEQAPQDPPPRATSR